VRDRYQGFRLAHTERGLSAPEPVPSSFEEADGVRFAEEFLAGERDADGIFCGNDELALSVMDHLIRHGVRVPDDLAIVGWDDVMAARYVRPGLTTVRQPVRTIGELAATRLHQRVAGGKPADEPVVLPTQLVIRSSCGCPEPGPEPGPEPDPEPRPVPQPDPG
jgi:LacI family transcriptional regulator